MQRDNSGSLISAFINTVSEFKDHVTKEINALDRKLQNAQDAINSRVESEVYGLKCEIDTLKQKLTNMEQLMEQRASLDLTTSDYPQAFEDQNPFSNETIPRNIMPPACKKEMSLQFRWEHFEYLCKTVLQRLKKPYKPEYLMAFKKNSPKYAAGLRDNIRSIHGLDSSATWSDLTDKIRREAEVLFEKLVDDEFLLRACVENWGAKLIMRKAFLKHDKGEDA
ncbi:hypothetical protein BDC45DRAFT_55134 [Circinella umbellata]|nr:hypothetical protein BDC45DRAFT_55134 [Circinella umbellata]